MVLGEYDTTTDPDCNDEDCAEPIQEILIEKFIQPIKYDSKNTHNDIILIKLQHPAVFNGKKNNFN